MTTVNIGPAGGRPARTARHQAALDFVELLLACNVDELEEIIAGAVAAARAAWEWRGKLYAAPWHAYAGLAGAVYQARLWGERPDPRDLAGALGGVIRALDRLPVPERAEWARRVARAAVGFAASPVSHRVLAAVAMLARALAEAGPA